MTTTEENLGQENNKLEKAQNLLPIIPKIDFDAVDKFYSEVEIIVQRLFKLGYHYGPPYEVKQGNKAPANILYKQGVGLLVTTLDLLFQDDVEVIEEVSKHTTFTCRSKMFRTHNKVVLASGEGSCSTDEGRFAYQAFEKIVTRHVRESAILRAHKDCIERYFNVSRFFPTNGKSKPAEKPPVKPQTATEEKFKWKYDMPDMVDPEWFKRQLKAAKSLAEIEAFAKQFKMELGMFEEKIMAEIVAVANQRKIEVKK
jgi:hypothetical protein